MIPKIVDRICDEFESSLRRGTPQRIEELLGTVEAELRSQLLYELLALEVEHKIKRGVVVYLDELSHRFPGEAKSLQRLVRSFLWEGSGFVAVSGADLMLRHFRLKAIIGRGAFGTVWLADDTRLDREVAIKTPHAYDGQPLDGLDAAIREAAAAAKLRHSAILRVHEVSEVDGHWFMVTDYAPSGTLRQLLATRPLTAAEVVELMIPMADALRCAHSHGVHHRDLKPSNVLLDERGHPLIADFGLALSARQPADAAVVCGTQIYMAPEQAEGRIGGERADLYSLGVILEDLLEPTHRNLISDSAQGSTKDAQRSDRLVLNALRRIRDKCCHLDPSQRYSSAEALVADLRRIAAGKPPRNIATPRAESLKWFVRGRWKLLAGITAGVLVTAAAVAMSSRRAIHPDARPVLISTEPAGCSITVYPLDPVTADPLTDRMERASGTSPVTMNLVPADYLVVAVLDGETFHEVCRHVPQPSEKFSKAGGHQAWRMKKGVVELPSIKVRPFAPLVPLVSVPETHGLLIAKSQSAPDFAERVSVPAFLAASIAVERQAVLDANGESEGSPRVAKSLFNSHLATDQAEAMGLRLPSAAESSALLHHRAELAAVGVVGLDDDIPEWTSSRPGAHGTGQMHRPALDSSVGAIMVFGLGSTTAVNSHGETLLVPKVESRHDRREDRGVVSRFVRSLKPRLNPEDFAQSVPAVNRPPVTAR